ncbi:hypothetical protein VTK26DRAFT_8056 [Humicola hyalothermophila]
MVFPGRFSTGCLRCRQRKVKCDEGKPSCRRCFIYGKPCPGYTDQFQFRHRRLYSSTETTPSVVSAPVQFKQEEGRGTNPARKGRRRSQQVPAREEKCEQQRQPKPEEQLPAAAEDEPWHAVVVRPPEPCYDDVSLFYFIRRFVSPNPEDGFPGHLSALPSLYESHSNGLLEVATLSVAQMAAYNQFGGDKFRVRSYWNYGRALRMMRDIIQAEDRVTDDKVIMSILLLCTLRDISGEGAGDPGQHAPGLFYLIEKRGPEQIATSRGAELLFLALIRLQVYSFLNDNDIYCDPGHIATVWGAFDPLLRALGLMSRTLSLRHKLLSFARSNSNDSNASHQPPDPSQDSSQAASLIVQTCFETLDDFHRWDAEAASYWQSTFEKRGPPTALGEVASGTTHYEPETACTMILIRSARLILLVSLIAYYHYHRDHDHDPVAAALGECVPVLERDVGLAIDDILASVPYALGDVGPGGVPGSVAHDGAPAIVIVHSIRLVESCAYTTPEQLQKAMEVLRRFNAGMGIRAAVGLRDADIHRTRWASEQIFLRSRMAMAATGSSPTVVGVDRLTPISTSISWSSPDSLAGSEELSPLVALPSPCSFSGQEQLDFQAVDFGCTIGS